jgi:hypothetical protein
MCLQEMRILGPDDPIPTHPVNDIDANVAPFATIAASSTHPECTVDGAVDATVAPVENPDNASEWAAHAEGPGAWIRFTWRTPVDVGRVILFDRPNALDQVTSVRGIFADGAFFDVGPLPDDAAEGVDVRLDARKTQSLTLVITGVKEGTVNPGFAEVALLAE